MRLESLGRRMSKLLAEVDALEQERDRLPACRHPANSRIADHGDETFYPREGCLDCDEWLEPVRLKRP